MAIETWYATLGWDHNAGEPVGGGLLLGEYATLGAAQEEAVVWAGVAPTLYGPGAVVLLGPDGALLAPPLPMAAPPLGLRLAPEVREALAAHAVA